MTKKVKKLPEDIAYLCVEGVIGVGKTSLCHLLEKEFNARLILEQADSNPFLPEFYKNPQSAAFQTQLWFLLSRYRQISEKILQQDLFYNLTISDYIFEKDALFASITLDQNELAMYKLLAEIINKDIPRPDYIIYLQASVDVLIRRIEKRNRPFENYIDRSYIQTLNEMYNHFFFHYTGCPVLIVNTDGIDYVNNSKDLEDIVDKILSTRWGSNYYRPLGSNERELINAKKKKTE
jgi:deoxyadenosine/deoxycytidine kinase